MNAALGLAAVLSIMTALVFTNLFKHHLAHCAGLIILSIGLLIGMVGDYEVCYRWACGAVIVIGITGCVERFYQRKTDE